MRPQAPTLATLHDVLLRVPYCLALQDCDFAKTALKGTCRNGEGRRGIYIYIIYKREGWGGYEMHTRMITRPLCDDVC